MFTPRRSTGISDAKQSGENFKSLRTLQSRVVFKRLKKRRNLGLVALIHIKTKKTYISVSHDIDKRFHRLKVELRNNKHRNKLLQEDYIKYGHKAFKFSFKRLGYNSMKRLNINQVNYFLDELFANYLKKHKVEYYNKRLTPYRTTIWKNL